MCSPHLAEYACDVWGSNLWDFSSFGGSVKLTFLTSLKALLQEWGNYCMVTPMQVDNV